MWKHTRLSVFVGIVAATYHEILSKKLLDLQNTSDRALSLFIEKNCYYIGNSNRIFILYIQHIPDINPLTTASAIHNFSTHTKMADAADGLFLGADGP